VKTFFVSVISAFLALVFPGLVFLALVFLDLGVAQAQTGATTSPAVPTVYVIFCGTLIDGVSAKPHRNVRIDVQGDKIKAITPEADPDWNAGPLGGRPYVIDLANYTCLPGLIDVHTHVLLQGDIIVDYDEQLLKESAAYRAIRATVAARRALEFGFTSIRDLETEGAGYADVDLRNAIDKGIIPGPRMQVATRAMDVTGAYPLLGYSWDLEMPHGVQVVDGPEEGRKAVREQISHGADWIKVYSDRGNVLRPDGVLEDIPTFTLDELKSIVDETHRQHRKIASHATGINGVHNSVEAGVDTVEHGSYIAPEDLKTMAAKGIWYVPTPYLAFYRAQVFPKQADRMLPQMKVAEDTFRRAMAAGVKIAYGTDAGAFEWTITPAVQFPVMIKYGMTPMQAIQSATIQAADLLGVKDRIGSIETGKLADIVATSGDPLADISRLQDIAFVMKDGKLVKKP